MLLPDNIRPEFSVYYNGALILKELKSNSRLNILDLYVKVKICNEMMSFSIFLLSLDWLYLIQMVKVNDIGEVEICL